MLKSKNEGRKIRVTDLRNNKIFEAYYIAKRTVLVYSLTYPEIREETIEHYWCKFEFID